MRNKTAIGLAAALLISASLPAMAHGRYDGYHHAHDRYHDRADLQHDAHARRYFQHRAREGWREGDFREARYYQYRANRIGHDMHRDRRDVRHDRYYDGGWWGDYGW